MGVKLVGKGGRGAERAVDLAQQGAGKLTSASDKAGCARSILRRRKHSRLASNSPLRSHPFTKTSRAHVLHTSPATGCTVFLCCRRILLSAKTCQSPQARHSAGRLLSQYRRNQPAADGHLLLQRQAEAPALHHQARQAWPLRAHPRALGLLPVAAARLRGTLRAWELHYSWMMSWAGDAARFAPRCAFSRVRNVPYNLQRGTCLFRGVQHCIRCKFWQPWRKCVPSLGTAVGQKRLICRSSARCSRTRLSQRARTLAPSRDVHSFSSNAFAVVSGKLRSAE